MRRMLLVLTLVLAPILSATQGVVIRNKNDTDNVTPAVVCEGVNVSSGIAAVNDLVQAQPAGTIFCFPAGTYALDETIEAKTNQQFIGSAGAILDGHNAIATAFHGFGTLESYGIHHVTVSGFEIKNFTGEAVQMGWYWTVSGNNIHNNLIGATINGYSTLDNNHIHTNGQYGINGGPGTDMTISNNEVNGNNTSSYCGGSCGGDAGGSKIVGSTAGTYNLVWRNNNVHDNIGMGIWSDGNVRCVIEDNTVTGNTEGGIFHEISWDCIIRNNTLADNAEDVVGMSCYWGSNLHINTSTNVEIYGNTITANDGANGICVIASDRADAAPPYPTGAENVDVHDNVIKTKNTAVSGLIRAGSESYSGSGFTNNDWFVTDDTAERWYWPTLSGGLGTWPEWQGAVQDTTGSVSEW